MIQRSQYGRKSSHMFITCLNVWLYSKLKAHEKCQFTNCSGLIASHCTKYFFNPYSLISSLIKTKISEDIQPVQINMAVLF